MKTRTKKNFTRLLACLMILPLMATVALTLPFGTRFVGAANGGIAIPGYNTLDEAKEAAADLNIRMTGEGSVLLKNNGALPLAKRSEKVTVFGAAATALQGGTGTVNKALADGGFAVNETVITEDAAADATAATVGDYSDVVVVVLKRGGGEGSDLSVATAEKADDTAENAGGWKHTRLAQNAAGEDVKHGQMLTAAELAMLDKAAALCDKVVVLLNTSNAMEMYNLEKDADVDAIMFIGRPGTNGVKAVPKLLSGEYNPSGKLADEWIKDFSADPTWYNSIANVQNDAGSNKYITTTGNQASSISLHGVDYSEDIYLGYKYSSTVYAEILAGNLTYSGGILASGAGNKAEADAWYDDYVVYPFGYGLSYTNFDMEIKGISATELSAAQVSSSIVNKAVVKTVTIAVEVTNRGSLTGKEVVEIYSQPPYTAGGIEKASLNLVAYAKTYNLRPGQSQTLTLTVNLQDMASYDYADANGNGFKGYELEDGDYNLYASNSSRCTDTTPMTTLTINGDAKLALDDFSDNEIVNLFSKENGRNYSLRKNDADWNADGVVDANDKMFTKEQVLLSRSDLVGTFPEAPVTTVDGIAVSQFVEFSDAASYVIGDRVKVTTNVQGVTSTFNVDYYEFTSAHAPGDFNAAEVTKLSGEYAGGLVVTDGFVDLMEYYARYDLNRWDTDFEYFSPTVSYAAGAKFALENTKQVYTVDAAKTAVPVVTNTGTFPVDSYLLSGSTIYKVIKELPVIDFIDNGSLADGKASRDYSIGDYVTYKSTNSWNGSVSTNNVRITRPVKAGDTLSSSSWTGTPNCTAFNAAMRLVTSGEDANVELISYENYIKNVLGATLTADVNEGRYTYTDGLFTGTAGLNGYNANAEGLYDVTAGMMVGWGQIESASAQTAAREAAGADWIYFNELSGIKFNDTSMITSGKFAGMTGEQVWVKFMNQWTWNDFYTACWSGGNNGNPIDNLGIPSGGVADNPVNWNGTYTWCCNTTIAQTWNIELGEEQGGVTADMGLLKNLDEYLENPTYAKKDQWLNPAINMHRTPFSGRNNEYYSQDGYHGGWFAQAVVKGIQARGVGSHLKHMFLNDQETNRNSGDLFAWVSEQAIREIWVKPFQMAIQEGGAEGAMSAFARVGSVPTPVSDNMCNLLVRKEWGATNFFFHPDMYSPQANVASEDLMLRTGHNHAPGGNNTTNEGTAANNTYSGRWDATYENELTGGLGGVYIGRNNEGTGQEAYYSNNQWYIVRYSAMIMYSEYANQAHAQNGIIVSRWTGGNYSVNAKDSVRLDIGFAEASEKASVFNYTITDGTLPEGLTLDARTGIISGSATAAGTYTITVRGIFDKWIAGSADFTITVGRGIIVSAAVNASGELVLTYADESTENLGVVKGANGANGTNGTNGTDGVDGVDGKQWYTGSGAPAAGLTANENDLYLDTASGDVYSKGASAWTKIANIKGADGAPGANGTDGAPGADGKDATGGCGSSVQGTSVLAAALMIGLGCIIMMKRRKENKEN